MGSKHTPPKWWLLGAEEEARREEEEKAKEAWNRYGHAVKADQLYEESLSLGAMISHKECAICGHVGPLTEREKIDRDVHLLGQGYGLLGEDDRTITHIPAMRVMTFTTVGSSTYAQGLRRPVGQPRVVVEDSVSPPKPVEGPIRWMSRIVDGAEVLDVDTWKPISAEQDLPIGTEVIMPGLFGYGRGKVVSPTRVESEHSIWNLKRGGDDRNCWTSSSQLNKRCLDKIDLKMED